MKKVYQNQGARACGHTRMQKHGAATRIALSFIRTMTVGFGVEPNLLTPLLSKEERALAG